ncbi:reverse transcriptase domain-containing protein, partial [Mycobacterium kansasii]
EVYVDDMLVKSIRASNHISDLGETFSILRKYRMKLNPSKCVFGVGSSQFLGF